MNSNEKRRKTCLKIYGVDNVSRLDETKLKIKETNFKKFGVHNPNNCKSVRDKIDATNLKKFGVKNVSNCPRIRRKAVETTIEHLGVPYSMMNSEVKNKMVSTKLDKSFESLKNLQNLEPLFERKDWHGFGPPCFGDDHFYKWRCKVCGNEFVDYIKSCITPPVCKKCSNKLNSSGEEELRNFIKSFYSGKIRKDRNTLNGKEIDIFLPDLGIGFEFNGGYYHSVQFGRNENYHLKKTIACEKLGIRLFHIWESDWNSNKNELKRLIKGVILEEFHPNENEFILDRSFPKFKLEDLKDFEIVSIIPPRERRYKNLTFFDCGAIYYRKKC